MTLSVAFEYLYLLFQLETRLNSNYLTIYDAGGISLTEFPFHLFREGSYGDTVEKGAEEKDTGV